jgi:hypothetical protein
MIAPFSETLLACARAASSGSLPDCKPFGFTIVDWLTILASLASILGGLYWLINRILLKVDQARIRNFKTLRKAIRPLMEDNSRIFSEFGPNSGAHSKGSVRFDVSVWKRARFTIGENNLEISRLIRDHQDLIPARHRKTFGNWLTHIDAFAAHLEDETVDYRNHQFPAAIPDIIRNG